MALETKNVLLYHPTLLSTIVLVGKKKYLAHPTCLDKWLKKSDFLEK